MFRYCNRFTVGGAGSLQSVSEEEHLEEVDLSREHHADVDVQGDWHPERDHPRLRRRRSFYSERQRAFLEAAFSCSGHYPDQRQREQLARSLGVTETRVQVGNVVFYNAYYQVPEYRKKMCFNALTL